MVPTAPHRGTSAASYPPGAGNTGRIAADSDAAREAMSSNRTTHRALPPELAGARVADFPLRGEWVAVHTPGSRSRATAPNMLAQRYAFDLMRLDRRRRYHPASLVRTLVLGVPTRECYGWGEPVHSMLAGEVVAAVDGVAERARIHPVRELAVVGWNALTFTAARLPAVVGNHVIVRHGDAGPRTSTSRQGRWPSASARTWTPAM